MLRMNVPAFKLETLDHTQTITHVNGSAIRPVTFKDVTVLGLGTVLVYPIDSNQILSLSDSDRVHVES